MRCSVTERRLSGLTAHLIVGYSRAATAATFESAPAPRIVVYKTPVGGDELRLHIFTPPGHDPATDLCPTCVFFFGGGWLSGTPTQFYPHCQWFSQARGMVTVSAEYRTRNSHDTDPYTCVADGRSAMRWIRSHADELGLDPIRIAAAGGSAGGHVAIATACCATLDDEQDDKSIDPTPDALLLFNPVYDNGPAEGDLKTEPGYGYERVADRWAEISPLHIIESAPDEAPPPPPSLVLFGERDPLVPVPTMQRFQVACREAGAVSELVIYASQAHGFFNGPKRNDELNEFFFLALEAADLFLRERGWISSSDDVPDARAFFSAVN